VKRRAEGREGRWELHDGALVAMTPGRMAHLKTKAEVLFALRGAIDRAGAPCRVIPDGAMVRMAARTAFEPDALVYCGPRLPPEAIEIPNPTIVVEVLCPGTAGRDRGPKLKGYFSMPSVVHYLILDADTRMLIHHKRGQGDIIETRVVNDGDLRLDPPGLEMQLARMFAPE